MSTHQSQSGFVNIDNAKLYYEVAGIGTPLVMVHAGVADSRQLAHMIRLTPSLLLIT